MNHITEQMNKSREEFDKKFKCDCFLCAEKGHPFETTNVEMQSFLASTQLALLLAVKEEVGEDAKKPFTFNKYEELYNQGMEDGINYKNDCITQKLDEAIATTKGDI